MANIIELKNTNFWYNRREPSEMWALQNISLEISAGEYVAFFGPSGSGKSTLLYLLSGIEAVQDGQTVVNGKDLSSFTKDDLSVYRQSGVGMVFQQFNLLPSLTVQANVELPMAFLGVPRAERKDKALNLLKRLSIEHLAKRYPYELSGGQQQRVGIARALSNDPPLIIADEPLGNLDSANANNVLDFLKELNEKDGKTIIMVTHEAWSLKDARRIFYLQDGRIEKVGGADSADIAEALSQRIFQHLGQGQKISQGGGDAQVVYSLSCYLFEGYSQEETERFRDFMSRRVCGKLDSEAFFGQLSRPFRQGGGGLWKTKARKVTNYVDEALKMRELSKNVASRLEKDSGADISGEAESVRKWLVSDYRGKLSEEQNQRLLEIITESFRRIIDIGTFKKILFLKKSKAGAGLSLRSTERLYEKMRLLTDEGSPAAAVL